MSRIIPRDEQITDIVMESFEKRPLSFGGFTANEVKRRTEFAINIWETLIVHAGWSQQRIIDHMLQFIVRRIDGQGLPDSVFKSQDEGGNAMWSPRASRKVKSERRLSALAKDSSNDRSGKTDKN